MESSRQLVKRGEWLRGSYSSHRPQTEHHIFHYQAILHITPYLNNTINRYLKLSKAPFHLHQVYFIASSAVPSAVLYRHLYSLLCTTPSSLFLASSAGLSRPLSISSAGLHLAYF
jgi:hypothetical protein